MECIEGLSDFQPNLLAMLKASNFDKVAYQKRQRIKKVFICEPCAFDKKSDQFFDYNSDDI